MKKSMFFLAMAAVAMSSCSKDETSQVNMGDAIHFRTSMGTRMAELNSGDILSEFTVSADKGTGTAYFQNVLFKNNSGEYTSDSPIYWPSDGSSLTFYAFTNLPENAVTEFTDESKMINNFQIATDVTANTTAQLDFVSTDPKTSTKPEADGAVQLEFKHRLAQVQIQAKSANTNYEFRVAGYRFGRFYTTADFNLTNAGWTNLANADNYEFTYADGSYTVLGTDYQNMMAYLADAGTNYNLGVIPQTLTAWTPATDNEGAYLALYMQILTNTGSQVYPTAEGAFGWVAVPVPDAYQLADNNKYIFQLDFSEGAGYVDPDPSTPVGPDEPYQPGDEVLSGGKVKFNVQIQDWENPTAKPVE